MSNAGSNENQEFIALDAEGKVIVNDPALAEKSGLVADDELEGVAGGVRPITDDNGMSCFCSTSKAFSSIE